MVVIECTKRVRKLTHFALHSELELLVFFDDHSIIYSERQRRVKKNFFSKATIKTKCFDSRVPEHAQNVFER